MSGADSATDPRLTISGGFDVLLCRQVHRDRAGEQALEFKMLEPRMDANSRELEELDCLN